jgi:hypothetical protein
MCCSWVGSCVQMFCEEGNGEVGGVDADDTED